MPGHNQHFIPRHFLYGFAIRGRPKFAWEYRAGVAPDEPTRLKDLAASPHFYSEPCAGGDKALDDDITDYENGLAQRISALRYGPPGPLTDPRLAAEIVAHLSLRNDSVRGGITYGFKRIVLKFFGLVSEEDGMQRILGLDRREASAANVGGTIFRGWLR